jgi:HK97 family phage major capsid protein
MATATSIGMKEARARNKELMADMVRSFKETGTKIDNAQWQRYLDEDQKLSNEIKVLELEERQAADQAALQLEKLDKTPNAEKDSVKRYQDVFTKYYTRGVHDLSREERDILTRGTGNQTTTTTEGGYTIAEGFSDQLFVNRALWGGMFEVATIYRTDKGNTIPWPKVDDTSVVGGLITEGSSHTVSDLAYTEMSLDSYLYSSYTVKVSEQLLQDSAFNVQEHLANDIFRRRIGAAENAAFTTANGSSKPNGFINAASSGVTAAAVTTVTQTEINSLVHSVDPVWRRNGKFMMNDSSLQAIKVVSLGQASTNNGPLWSPAMGNDQYDKIHGYDVVINQDMAALDNSSKSVAFGDFSQYIIRIVNGSQRIRRFDELYAANLLVGFVGYERVDGDLLATNAIKYITQAST